MDPKHRGQTNIITGEQLKNRMSKKIFSSPDNPLEASNYSYFNGHGKFENCDTKQVYSRKNIQTPTQREQNHKLAAIMGQEITPTGYHELEAQLDYLTNIALPNVKNLFTNAESYFEKTQTNEQKDLIISQIHDLTTTLAVSIPVRENHSRQLIQMGSTVTIAFLADGEKEKFRIGVPQEATICPNTISTSSPLGHALLGKRVNQQVYYNSSDGKIGVAIINIEN